MGKHVVDKRVTLHTLVAPKTLESLRTQAKERKVGQGVIVDEQDAEVATLRAENETLRGEIRRLRSPK